jgi:DNA polymerase
MQIARLKDETDFEGWRSAARRLCGAGIAPAEVLWTTEAEAGLFATPSPMPAAKAESGFTVPRGFVEMSRLVVLHRSAARWALLYRLLWRLRAQPHLLECAADADVMEGRRLAREVDKASHKMKAFVRFREITADDGQAAYVAWFEPAHRVVELTAPFFVERFANMRFSILTPDACAHWDTRELVIAPGAERGGAPAADELEDVWRTYYASVFNPARLKVGAMKKEMPVRYWRNLPEAALIPELIASAEDRTREMVRQTPTEPSKRALRAAQRLSRDAPFDGQAPTTLEEIAAGIQVCRRCELWRDATQGVPGEGPAGAKLMFVGEQPGDQEDLAGRPFVGPAGQVLDKALAAAGVPRAETFVTNAVKHFKHEPRGKRRLHKTPDAGEVSACRWWLDHERRIVRPRVVVALGATAALSVFGKPTPIGKFRQQAIQLPDQAQGVVTYHPSYLLRVPDAEAKEKAFGLFVEDLRFAWRLAG